MTEDARSAPPEGGRNYSVEEVADMLHCTDDTVYRAIKRGDLASFRVGRAIRITDTAYLEFTGRAAS